jgi:hypothetical protein
LQGCKWIANLPTLKGKVAAIMRSTEYREGWEKICGCKLSDADLHEIEENLAGFFGLLDKYDKKEKEAENKENKIDK